MFNERGIVIGVVVSKARLENTGFAVPIGEVLKFLGASPDKPEALTQSLRTWTDVTGQFRIKATLVQKVGNIVRLKKESGEVIAIPLNKLSEQDRRLIETNQTTEKK